MSYEPGQDEQIFWLDLGEMGCGELLLKIKLQMAIQAPGSVLELHATDLGALEDIPAWCRMTGHLLLRHDAVRSLYWIERRPR